MVKEYCSAMLIVIFSILFMIGNVQGLNELNGWILPTGSGDHNKYVGFGTHYKPGGIHLGQDFEGDTKDPVYALADGEVIESRTNVGGYGPVINNKATPGGALIALFTTSDGSQFMALYGHINNPHPKGIIEAGDVLGYMNEYDPSHLHFGIHPGKGYPSDNNPWRGFITEAEYAKTKDTYGWVDPVEFLERHGPITSSSDVANNAPVAETLVGTTPAKESPTSQSDQQSETKFNDDTYWAQSGYELMNQDRYEEALQALTKSIELNPSNTEVWRNKGVALYFLGRYDEAIQATEKAIEIDPSNTNAVNQKDQFVRQHGTNNGNQNTPTQVEYQQPASEPLPEEFFEEPSYDGDCENRPEAANCVRYSDGYISLLGITVNSYGDGGIWNGKEIEVAYATNGCMYDHILGTSYVGRRCNS